MHTKIITFGGAKGGSGKSTTCEATALTLSSRGRRVGVNDFDFTSPMLADYINERVTPDRSVAAVLYGDKSLEEASFIKNNITYVLGSSGLRIPTGINPSEFLRPVLSGVLDQNHAEKFDYTLLDLSAGDYAFTNRFLLISDVIVLVIEPREIQIENVFGQIKTIYTLYQKINNPHLPQIIIVTNKERKELFSNDFNAKKILRNFESTAQNNHWLEKIDRPKFFAGGVSVHLIPEVVKDPDFIIKHLRNFKLPKELIASYNELTDLIESLPASQLSLEERQKLILGKAEKEK